jgi:hypothetical protein
MLITSGEKLKSHLFVGHKKTPDQFPELAFFASNRLL